MSLLALRFAGRELRGGLAGLRIFVACLTLGVAAIAGVGSASRSVERGIDAEARVILGGEVEVSQRLAPIAPAGLAWLAAHANISRTTGMRAMARAEAAPAAGTGGGRPVLVELKAVDGHYPLFGEMRLAPDMPLAEALAERNGAWGAVVERAALAQLGITLGEVVRIGEARFQIKALIEAEPDRGTSLFTLGPRVMAAAESLVATGLVRPGSLIRYNYRARLPVGEDPAAWVAALRAAFPDTGWRVRGLGDAAPGLRHWLGHIQVYLTLVGLTALLVGGVGVANAVRSYLDGRIATIATFKCLGADGGFIFRVYLAQILIIALVGILLGLTVGALAPWVLSDLLADRLHVAGRPGLFATPLLLAAGFGLLTALAFSLWPLARAREVTAAGLFRDLVVPARRWPRARYTAATAAAALAFAGLAVCTSDDRWLAAYFVVGAALTLSAFRGAGHLLARLAARASRSERIVQGRPGLRLALANLHRPGAPMPHVVLSLGIGLTVLVAVALVEGNLAEELSERMPVDAPAYYFIDIQPDQVAAFDKTVGAVPGVTRTERVPSLRGRIVRVAGIAISKAKISPDVAWITRSDRGLTYAAAPPPGTEVVAGEWWSPGYAGPPLVSFDAMAAQGMGLGVGDTLTVNILGRVIEAKIANLRRIDWARLGINFVMVFSPGALEAAPQTHIATAYVADEDAEAALEDTVARRFANVSAVRVKDALDALSALLAQIGGAVRVVAAITLVVGALVLGGAVAAGHRRRVYDAVVLKVLGATRRDVLGAYLVEYGFIGLATAAIAAFLGTVVAWAVVTQVMSLGWRFMPGAVLAVAALSTLFTLGAGFLGTWRALGRKPMSVLRNP
jgi:putative ABC transport system permease protein